MKNKLLLILLCSFTYQVFSQNLILNNKKESRVTKFSNELQQFIKECNNESPKLCQYFVYVVYVYPINNQETSIGYTVSYIYNFSDNINIKPQYHFYVDSTNLVVVRFNPAIKKTSIPGFKLNKLTNMNVVNQKLLPEKEGFITGISRAFIYNDYPKKKERINYESLDMIPVGKSIFINHSDAYEIRLINNDMQDSTDINFNK